MSTSVSAEIPQDLCKGIEGAELLMHARDFHNAAKAIAPYLGRDLLAEQVSAEFTTLPPEEQERLKKEGLGKYGIFDLVSKPEVALGLNLVASQISSAFTLSDRYRGALNDPKQVEKITQRFPDMTAARIAMILS